MFFKIGFLKILQYLLEVCNFVKKRPHRRYFPVNVAKFLRTALFIEHLLWLVISPISNITSLIPFRELLNNNSK